MKRLRVFPGAVFYAGVEGRRNIKFTTLRDLAIDSLLAERSRKTGFGGKGLESHWTSEQG